MRLIYALLMAVIAVAETSGQTIVEQSETYAVSGSTASDLRANMNRVRPKDPADQPADGVTYWDMRWKHSYTKTSDTCMVSSVTITMEIRTKLPWWIDRQPGTTLVERWDGFIIALKNHEEGHAEIARRGAAALRERLSGLSARTCPLLDELADATADALVDHLKKENAAYDQRTRHGASQGVRFP